MLNPDLQQPSLEDFGVECVIWTNSKLSALAQQAFPKDPGQGSRHLDEALSELALKIGHIKQLRGQPSVRISSGFELAVYSVLQDNGLTLPEGYQSKADPGGLVLSNINSQPL